jgi:hypothetical protein
MGDHPDWELSQRTVRSVVFDSCFYVALHAGDALLDLSPFLLALCCPECHQRHVYYPDKLQEKKAILNSIDRGHQRHDSSANLLRALQDAIPRP